MRLVIPLPRFRDQVSRNGFHCHQLWDLHLTLEQCGGIAYYSHLATCIFMVENFSCPCAGYYGRVIQVLELDFLRTDPESELYLLLAAWPYAN